MNSDSNGATGVAQNQTGGEQNRVIGRAFDRVDGKLKVTGAATYSAEHKAANPAHAVIVRSECACGTISDIDTRAAERAPGVLFVLTHKNMPRLNKPADTSSAGTMPGEDRLPLSDDKVHYAGQHIAVVVAETLEQAEHAARLVRATYARGKPAIVMEREGKREKPEKFFGMEDVQIRRGDAARGIGEARVKIEQQYSTPTQHHNPIEPHATVAVWQGDNLTVYDATQAVVGSHKILASVLGLPEERVHLVSSFVGGGFGCKGLVWWHTTLAAVAARQVKRPVKLVLTRQQMFTSNGHRGRTVQQIALGADSRGKLTSVRHDTTTHQSEVGNFLEPCGLTTRMLYAAPNLEIAHTTVRLNVGTPTPMRAPGESPGMFALESALDELAYELKIDPIQLRLTNHADRHPHDDREWSAKHLKECYRIGADKFGWSRRDARPRQNRDGRFLVGYGMASATYPGYRSPATARVTLKADGTAVVQSATQDIGTGTYTVMAMIAADALGLPVERVRAELGDSRMPNAPTSGGSTTVASVGPAVRAACLDAREQVVRLATADSRSPLNGRRPDEIAFAGGRLFLRSDSSSGETYAEVLRRSNRQTVEACVTAQVVTPEAQEEPRNPATKANAERAGAGNAPCNPVRASSDSDADQKRFAFQSFGAQFAEVGVDENLGVVRVRRFVSVQDIGRVINQKTAESQVRSGVIYGIGAALMEETVYDERNARPVVRTLADYHFPAHADIPRIEVHFVGTPDPRINSLGARGVGEIGITGVAAAVANAVFNATGKRIRDLPLTPDKLL